MKNILIIICCLVILVGCSRKEKLDDSILDNQAKVKENLEKKSNNIAIKFTNDNKEQAYYLYKIDGENFIQYLYTIHNTEKSYNEHIKKYESNTYYKLERLDDSLVTIITLQKGSSKNLDEKIKKKYEDKKYEIIK